MNFKNLTETHAFSQLVQLGKTPPSIRQLSPSRVQQYAIQNGPFQYFFGASLVDEGVLAQLQALADEQGCVAKIAALQAGALYNTSEKRPAKHHLLRAKDPNFYTQDRDRLVDFVTHVHDHKVRTQESLPFTHVVQVGIGGSELGARLVAHALEGCLESKLVPDFLCSMDPDEAHRVLKRVPFKTTLWLLASKSGNTQELQLNQALIESEAQKQGLSQAQIHQHMVALTMPESALDQPSFLARFYIDEAIGGRFSCTSIMGIALAALCFGPSWIPAFMAGARQMDMAASHTDCRQNASLMDALLTIWERNILHFAAKAIIPYTVALSYWPSFVQQLSCESNGKRVNRDQQWIEYATSPVVFGERGTNAQHSFFQNFHQGTHPVPIQFLAFRRPQSDRVDPAAQAVLNANAIAQIQVLAQGLSHDDPNQDFPGNRPSTLLLADQVTPETLGALVAFYENKVVFESFLWNINAFDQEGVQLGKIVAKSVLHSPTPSEQAWRTPFQF